ncbi:MAG: ABC transporter permease [Spirochaetota bacterium]
MNTKNSIDMKEFALFFFFLLLCVFFSVFASGFLRPTNLLNVARQVSIIGIVSVGMTIVILTGGIDLSVGAIVGVAATGAAFLMINLKLPIALSAVIGILLGGAIGLLNGIMVAKFNIPPLITTLATMTSFRGVSYIITKGIPIYGFEDSFAILGQGYVGPIPIPVIIMLAVFLFGSLMLGRTRFGRHVYGLGGNEEAARLAGLDIGKIKLMVFAISGLLAGFAGIVLLSRLMTGAPTLGTGFEMDVITAVVLGGVSIAGGEGKLRGVIIGVLIMGVLSNGMIIMSLDENYQWLVRGFVLALAVGFDRNSKRTRN